VNLLIPILFGAACLILLLACGMVYQAIGTARDCRRFPPPGRLVDIGGRRLHLIDTGAGALAVVFESGISASCLNWTHVRTRVSGFTRACAYDRGSLGWSDPADSRRIASRLVKELRMLLLASGVPPPYVLVGHSFGGLLVGMYAAVYPDQVAGLVLVDPLPATEWLNVSGPRARMLARGVRLARRGAWLARIGVVRFALALFSGGARKLPKFIARLTSGRGESVVSRLVGEVGKMPREVWPMVEAHWCLPRSFEGLAAALDSLPASSAEAAGLELPGSIPLTILSARHCAPGLIADREALAGRSVRGRHMVASQSGHWIQLDQPELVIQAIREMIEAAGAATV
jgi:pimeloyl-ACP methyl ester carboxylesterase